MTLQTTVANGMGFGVVGEEFLAGPRRAQPGIIDSDGVTNGPNYVGYGYTQVTGADGHCALGAAGGGVFFGWAANPKVYPEYGTTGNSLAPSLALRQYTEAEFVYDSTGFNILLPAAANIGDLVYFDNVTGAPFTQPKVGNVAGAGTAATASNVLTVAALPAGSPPIGIGSVITLATGDIATVTSLGTGTGGNGTYNVTPTPDHAAQAFSSTTVTPTGKTRAPAWEVVRYNIPAAGLAVIGVVN